MTPYNTKAKVEIRSRFICVIYKDDFEKQLRSRIKYVWIVTERTAEAEYGLDQGQIRERGVSTLSHYLKNEDEYRKGRTCTFEKGMDGVLRLSICCNEHSDTSAATIPPNIPPTRPF
jgi:hypothetical protein